MESPRLRYARLSAADSGFLRKLMNSPGWLANIGDRGIHSDLDAANYIRDKITPSCTAPWLGPYAMRQRDTKTAIGTIGIYARPGLDIPDLGFALLPEFFRQGYAHEAAEAIITKARAGAGLQGQKELRLSAITLPQNLPSIRLLERLGFQYLRPVVLPNDTETLHYYEAVFPSLSSARHASA